VPAEIDPIIEAAKTLAAGHAPPSFRVAATRADKRFPLPSPEIERRVGGVIHDETGWPVDLSAPAFVLSVEVLPGAAYVSVDRRRGFGGLPVGVGGRVACLLSGGIDSPVAAFRLMRRGCRVVFVHCHSYPITTVASQEKARQLVRILTRYQLRSRLVLVPFGDLQRQVVVATPPPARVVIYRRFMLRVAERIARRLNARALVTGEAIGQVSSQTLENLATIDAATSMPVLRPLIGMDKEDITAEARRIRTYEVSILPDEDCCQVFVPRNPAINVNLAQAAEAEEGLPIDAMVREAVDRSVRERFALGDAD
jgi:thiamine biosynthesis protein ThiI